MTAGNDGIPMLTTSGVARLLNVHVNTVRRWSNQGILKSYRIGPRGDRRFNEEDIANFLLNEENARTEYKIAPLSYSLANTHTL